jgi:hypothetical protein
VLWWAVLIEVLTFRNIQSTCFPKRIIRCRLANHRQKNCNICTRISIFFNIPNHGQKLSARFPISDGKLWMVHFLSGAEICHSHVDPPPEMESRFVMCLFLPIWWGTHYGMDKWACYETDDTSLMLHFYYIATVWRPWMWMLIIASSWCREREKLAAEHEDNKSQQMWIH